MARSLRRLIALLTVLPASPLFVSAALLTWPNGSQAECTPATVYTGDCDFKNEDTHLWLIQPGEKFISDDNTDTLVSDAWTAIHEYYSTTKTLGDEAIRGEIEDLRDAIDRALGEAVASLAATAANDPWDLKPLYTDAICDLFWGALLERDCKTTNELVLDAQRVWNLGEVRVAIARLEAEQFLFLGEEWGDILGDVQRIKDQFDELETLGRNLAPEALSRRVGERFPGYAQVLAGAKTTEASWHAARREVSASLNATLRDTMAASKEIGDVQAAEDRGELARLTRWSRESVGRMQQMELGNMTDTQSNQAWLKIEEIVLQRGNLTALDMASEMHEDSVRLAEGERARRQLPTVGTVIGNEVGAILP